MTPTQQKAMEMALACLVRAETLYGQPNQIEQKALRAALAEPEPRNQCGEVCERAKLCAICAREIDGAEQTDELGLRFVGYAVIATTTRRGSVMQLSKPDLRKQVADRCMEEWSKIYGGEQIRAEVCEVFVRPFNTPDDRPQVRSI